MTDNRTTELRRLLDERGVEQEDSELTNFHDGTTTYYTEWGGNDDGDGGNVYIEYVDGTVLRMFDATPEQAIAATLGSDRHPYKQRITGDGSDWGEIMRSAYDDLMANACESCTPEQIKQLVDYIRAELGSGTCEMETSWEIRDELGIADAPEDTWGYRCSACGDSFRYDRGIKPNFCPECGCKVIGG